MPRHFDKDSRHSHMSVADTVTFLQLRAEPVDWSDLLPAEQNVYIRYVMDNAERRFWAEAEATVDAVERFLAVPQSSGTR